MRAAFLLPLLFTGCTGLSQNPSYFPFYLPAGDIVRTHAKPPGRGYFKNFDPKACKIEVTPANQNVPTKAQVVLIATVFDKDGDARRKRRVEWQLEGPGTIVEVDESGILAGRGYQVTDKYAVSYTDMFTHTLTRGSERAADEITICAGQTWCVVSSPVAGETIVTAYAPEVYDWDKRRSFTRLVWSDGGFTPAIRSGRETDSTLRDRAKENGPAGLVLDAKLPKTVAVNRETTATVSLVNNGSVTSTGSSVRVVVPDGLEFVRSEPSPGRRNGADLYWNFDALDGRSSKDISVVLRPKRNGTFTLAAQAQTTDGLSATTQAETTAGTSGLSVSVDGSAGSSGDRADVKITATNTGSVELRNAVAWVTPGGGLSSPTAPLEVKVGDLAAGESKTVDATFAATRGRGTVRVDVTADGGVSARGEGTVTVTRSELQVRVVGPEVVPVGESGTFEVQVVNAGDVAIRDVDVEANLPRGFKLEGESQWRLASLAPGEKKVLRVAASGDRLSELGAVTATASAKGVPTAKTSAPASVRGLPILVLDVQSAGSISVGGRAVYKISLRNRGSGPARDVVVRVSLSSELKASRSFDAVTLAAGESRTFTLEAEAVSAGDARVNVEVTSKDLPNALRDEQATRVTGKR